MESLENGMKMLIVSSYPPRECGIATFTTDIFKAVKNVFGDSLQLEICALQNAHQNFDYPAEVRYILHKDMLENYRQIGEEINLREDIGLVCVQHEFGLYGGENGSDILALLLSINKPIITVFHTILPTPSYAIRKLMLSIADLSSRIVVLTQKSQLILVSDYAIQLSKIEVIPHGTHMVLWGQKEQLKRKYNLVGKTVLSTFGLLSENKSIETVINALPEIVTQNSNVVYLVIGKTHPEILLREGEKYRIQLVDLVEKLGLQRNVHFINEFVELPILLEYLTLSDIYLFSSKDPNQAVSGTLAYALSCGCPVISTPIPHAKEIVDGGGFLLSNFEDSEAFKEAILNLLYNPKVRNEMSKKSYLLSHATVWENVAIKYGLLFGEVTNSEKNLSFVAPPLKIDHLQEMTKKDGMLQFSNFSEPDPKSGYTLDDNARALIDIIMFNNQSPSEMNIEMANKYFNFIEGIQRTDGTFDNYKDFEGNLTTQNQEVNLEDSNGRALWSLGFVIANEATLPFGMEKRAIICFDLAIINSDNITSPRAIAYTIKGLYQYHLSMPSNQIKNYIISLADRLLAHYHINSAENWYWFEDYMTYANNVLPEAMLFSYLVTGEERYKEIALITFDFLLSHYFMKGELKVVSNNGWFKKKNERAFFGEQPIEVVTTIVALDLFYEVTGNSKYRQQIEVAFSWFLGNNHLKQIMYNTVNGASYDGLEDTQININQGAESTLCFFKAQMIMKKYTQVNEEQEVFSVLPLVELT
jgi:glycosyltransferase involved in cell wall biosynthesis